MFVTDSGPINLTIAATYDNGVRLKWVLPPTCYERTTIIVESSSINGRHLTWSVDRNADWFDLTGLDPETNYNLSFITEYGSQMSDPVVLQFRTIASPAALTGGAIAGISIGNIHIATIHFLGLISISYICLKFCIFIF